MALTNSTIDNASVDDIISQTTSAATIISTASSSVTSADKKGRPMRSNVWLHFTKDGPTKAICNYCQ